VPGRPVYNVLLARQVASAVGSVDLGSPPDGFIYVVKHMDVINQGGLAYPVAGFTVLDGLGGILWSEQQPWTLKGHTYQWHGSQVIGVGEHWFWRTDADGWSLRASGYELSLP
jgi:hypothetical protein